MLLRRFRNFDSARVFAGSRKREIERTHSRDDLSENAAIVRDELRIPLLVGSFLLNSVLARDGASVVRNELRVPFGVGEGSSDSDVLSGSESDGGHCERVEELRSGVVCEEKRE